MEIPINQFYIILQGSRELKMSDFLLSWPTKNHPAEQRRQNEVHVFDPEVPKRKHGRFIPQRTAGNPAIKEKALGDQTFVLLLGEHSYAERVLTHPWSGLTRIFF